MSKVQQPKISWASALRDAGKWLVITFIGSIGVAMLVLFFIGKVVAQESQRTYPARLGEQDRRLTTEQVNYGTPDHWGQYLSSVVEDTIDVVVSDRIPCREQNAYLYYLLADIARFIGQHPETGIIFQDAIQDIHNAWCIE